MSAHALDSGIFGAYLALSVMALLPIYYGAWGSLKGLKSKTAAKVTKGGDYETSSSEEEDSETLAKEDAYWFPVIGSCVLFGLYILLKYVDPEYFNALMMVYFFVLGVAGLTKVGSSIIKGLTRWRPNNFKIVATRRAKELLVFRFSYIHIAMAAFSTAVNAYYVYSRNWISCNMLGLAFATNAIQLLALDSFATGMILLMGLFFYDIFWVFGTDVMVTVARKFDAPVKVVFPRDLWAKEWHFAMLGLGDIVIPGVFIALCLRFDYHLALKRLRGEVPVGSQRYYSFPRTYFYTSFGAYVIGLLTTVTVMHVTGAAQPALLYLSPACISSVLLIAAVRGELKEFWSYSAEVKAVEDDVSLTENIINRVLDSPDSVSSATLLTTSKKTTLVQKTTTIRRVPSAEDEDYADAGAEADASDDEASTSSSAGNLSSKGRKKKSPKKSLKKN